MIFLSWKFPETREWQEMKWRWRKRGNQHSFESWPSGWIRYVREGGVTIGDIYIPPPPAPACTLDATGAAWCFLPVKLTSSFDPGPRLVITHIENENFKSYAGVQVLVAIYDQLVNIFCKGIGSFPQELHKHRGAKWKWKVQCDRLDALCLWLPRTEDKSCKALFHDSQQ